MFKDIEQEGFRIPTRVIRPQKIEKGRGHFTTDLLFSNYGHRGQLVLVRLDGQYDFEEVHLVPGTTVIRQDVGSLFGTADNLEIEVTNWNFRDNTFLVATEIRRTTGTT